MSPTPLVSSDHPMKIRANVERAFKKGPMTMAAAADSLGMTPGEIKPYLVDLVRHRRITAYHPRDSSGRLVLPKVWTYRLTSRPNKTHHFQRADKT